MDYNPPPQNVDALAMLANQVYYISYIHVPSDICLALQSVLATFIWFYIMASTALMKIIYSLK